LEDWLKRQRLKHY